MDMWHHDRKWDYCMCSEINSCSICTEAEHRWQSKQRQHDLYWSNRWPCVHQVYLNVQLGPGQNPTYSLILQGEQSSSTRRCNLKIRWVRYFKNNTLLPQLSMIGGHLKSERFHFWQHIRGCSIILWGENVKWSHFPCLFVSSANTLCPGKHALGVYLSS
jgi:hypothetical protein